MRTTRQDDGAKTARQDARLIREAFKLATQLGDIKDMDWFDPQFLNSVQADLERYGRLTPDQQTGVRNIATMLKRQKPRTSPNRSDQKLLEQCREKAEAAGRDLAFYDSLQTSLEEHLALTPRQRGALKKQFNNKQ